MKKILASLALSGLMLGGCLKATFVTNAPPVGGVQKTKVTFLVYGLLGQPAVVNAAGLCPGGSVHMVRTGMTAGNALLQGFTAGIIARRTVWYQCGGSAQNTPTESTPTAGIVYDDNGQPQTMILTNEDGSTQVGTITKGEGENEFVATFPE